MPRKYAPRPATPEGGTLDGFLLLEAGDDELPEGIQAVRLSGKNLAAVECADMAYFTGLRVLDLSDNRVMLPLAATEPVAELLQIPGLAPLAPLARLHALSLSLNRMTSLGKLTPTADFQLLTTLDLSYNQLEVEGCVGA
ncbi:uncharacterized protein HaLaN_29212, partial [Haematococcus lacustris]